MNRLTDPPTMPRSGTENLPTVIQLDVDGITGCGCVLGVKRALNVLYGVQDVEVKMSSGHVVVQGEGENMTQEKLASALRVAGFSLVQKHRAQPNT